MRVAVLTLTRDRLEYTEHCFKQLRENAGIPFDHYVLDQGSEDGTYGWLKKNWRIMKVEQAFENIGISRGMNRLVDVAGPGYDIYVKFDNDCELTEPDTLKRVVDVGGNLILSPRVLGLQGPPGIQSETMVGGERIGILGQIGGIFMAIPGWVFTTGGFRYNEANPVWGWDDVQLSQWFQAQGGRVGYLLDVTCNHYETTAGQWERFPEYFNRKVTEDGMPGSILATH